MSTLRFLRLGNPSPSGFPSPDRQPPKAGLSRLLRADLRLWLANQRDGHPAGHGGRLEADGSPSDRQAKQVAGSPVDGVASPDASRGLEDPPRSAMAVCRSANRDPRGAVVQDEAPRVQLVVDVLGRRRSAEVAHQPIAQPRGDIAGGRPGQQRLLVGRFGAGRRCQE